MPSKDYDKYPDTCVVRQTPVFLDHVRDHIRSRFLASLSITMLFAVVVFLIFSVFFRNPLPLYGRNIPSTFVPVLLPAATVDVTAQASGRPFAKFRVTNTRGFGVKDVAITARIASFNVGIVSPRSVGCSPFAGTLLVKQYEFLCSALVNTVAVTDRDGVAVFAATSFNNTALPGQYNITFDAGTFSESTTVTLSSPVAYVGYATLPDIDLADFKSAAIGATASLAFNIGVYDSEGQPVPNRVVRVISRNFDGSFVVPIDEYEPFSPDTTVYLPLPQTNKFVLVDNAVATSGTDGVAVLDSLTLLGATHPVAYLGFMCDGVVLNLFADIYDPPLLTTTVAALVLTTPPPPSVVEGNALATQPAVRVTDSGGAPLAGKYVFALIGTRDGVPDPEFLAYTNPLEDRKDLFNAIAGPTDADGVATFVDLGFGVGGPAGNYTLYFVCDGVPTSTLSPPISVTSTVRTISVSYFPPVPIAVPYEETAFPVVAITDAAGRPVAGKTPRIVPSARVHGKSHAQPSLANGLAFFDLLTVAAVEFDSVRGSDPEPFPPTTVELQVVVDSVSVFVNVSFVPEVTQYAAPVPVWIEPLVRPPPIIAANEVYNVSLQLFNVFFETVTITPELLFGNPLVPAGLFFRSSVEFLSSSTYVTTFEALTDADRLAYYNATLGSGASVFNLLFGASGYTGTFSYQFSLVPSTGPGAAATASPFITSDVLEGVLVNSVETIFSSVAGGAPGFGPTITVRDFFGAELPFAYVQMNVLPEKSSDDILFLALLGELQPDAVIVSNTTGFTDLSGQLTFGPPAFVPNVVGNVSLFFYAGGKLLSGLVEYPVPRVVANVTIVTPAAFNDPTSLDAANADVARFFVPFTTQPVVRLLDATGAPVVGARALVAVTDYPDYYSYFGDSDSAYVGRVSVGPGEESKVASMFSLPSDVNGLAVFEGIGVWFAPVVSSDTPTNVRLRYFSDGSVDPAGVGPVYDTGTPNVVRVLDSVVIRVTQQPSTVASLGVAFAQPIEFELVTAIGNVAAVTYAEVVVVSGPVRENADGTNSSLVATARLVTSPWPFQARSRHVVDCKFAAGALGRYELALRFPGAADVVLNAIELTARPSSLRIIKSPPLTVPVGGLFRITVRATISSGAVLGGVPVRARLVRGTTSVAKAVRLDQIGRNRLDPFRVTNTTDARGEAELSLTIESGEPGLYTLVVTADNAPIVSLPSRPFVVTNAVERVDIVVQPRGLAKPIIPTRTLNGKSETVLITSEGDQGAGSMAQPAVRVTGTVHGVSGQPMSGVAIEAVVVQSSTTDGSLAGTRVTVEDVSRPEVVWSAGSAVSGVDGIARFSDLRFSSGATGVYRLLFRARGIDSAASAPLLVTNVLVPDADRIGSFRIFVFVVLLITLPVMYGNIVGNSRYAMVVGILLSLVFLALSFVFLADATSPSSPKDAFAITLNVITSVVIIALIVWFVVVLVGAFGYVKTFMEQREEAAFGSVRRLLSAQHPVDYWEGVVRKAGESKVRSIRSAVADKLPGWAGDMVAPSPELMTNAFEPFEQSADFVYPQRLVVAAYVAGFFVVVMTLGAVVAVLWVLYKTDQAFSQLLRIELLLEKQQQALEAAAAASGLDTSSGDLRVALSASSSLTHYMVDLVDPSLYLSFRSALAGAGGVAIVGTVVFVTVMWVLMMRNYRKNIFRLRRGLLDKVLYKANKYKALRAPSYIGMQTAHTLAGYTTTFVILWIVLFLVFFSPTREYLASQILPIVLGLLSLSLVMSIVQKVVIAKYVVSKDDPFLLPNPRWWSMFELIYTFLNIVNGVSLTVVRFCGALGALVFTFLRTDYPVVNKTREHADPGYHAYVAMLLLDHTHNHPVVVVASQVLLGSLHARRIADGGTDPPYRLCASDPATTAEHPPPLRTPAQTRARTRWFLAITLANNPALAAERGHAIEAARAARNTLLSAVVVHSDGRVEDEMFAGVGAPAASAAPALRPTSSSSSSSSQTGEEMEMFVV